MASLYKPLTVLCCGDRNWSDVGCVKRALRELPPGTIIVHGACRGADLISGRVAGRLGLKVREYPADWIKYGRAAGPIRNRLMLSTERPDLVLAFHADLAKSKGTADMVRCARAAGVKVRVVKGRPSSCRK